jgi:hypothetical protein
VPEPAALADDEERGGAGGMPAARTDPDARLGVELPKNLKLWN